ncbi:MAG: 50S ribosomal protein L11 methyltransferase [Deltaproteobacteria bacterium]|nr:50S ribosomal protein L11 methyltransferase [Deltaproteobacteria bacterium]
MRDYCIVRLNLTSDLEGEVRSQLYRHPCLGLEFSPEAGRLAARAYFDADYPLAELRRDLERHAPALRWEGETRIRLPASGHSAGEPVRVALLGREILLRGGPAFGSGAHPTTRLAAALLGEIDLRGVSFLDLGAGTGILSILARKLGAAAVTAVEILPEARENAAENFRLNGAGGITLAAELGEAEGSYDLIVANILSPTLIALGDAILARLKPGGRIVLSGILSGELAEVLRAFRPCALERRLEEAEWRALRLRGR